MKAFLSVQWMSLFSCGGLGLTILFIGLSLIYKRLNLYCKGVKTIGTVVDTFTHRNLHEGHSSYSTFTVKFKTLEGKAQEFRSDFVDTNNKYHVGVEVIVIYNPAKPSEAEVKDFLTFAWTPFVIMVFGCWFLALGILSYLDEGAS